MERRGQGLSTNAIILIVLGVIVLVVLAAGFYFGWGALQGQIGSSNNVGTIVTACKTACTTQSKYDYCTQTRDLKTDTGGVKASTCYYLAENRTEFGIDKCGAISCSDSVLLKDKAALDSAACTDNAGKMLYAPSADGNTLYSKDCSVSANAAG